MTKKFKECKGITLVEILAVIVIGGMIFGLVLEIFVSTNLATKKRNIEAIMLQEATLIAQQVERALAGWLLESETGGEERERGEFKSDRLTFFRLSYIQPIELKLTTFKNIITEEGKRSRVAQLDKPAKAQPPATEEPIILGLNESQIATEIKFSYAREFKETEGVWLPELPEAEKPGLIKYTITITDLQNLIKPLILTSSVRLEK